MAKKSWVWLKGELREKTGDNVAVVDGENWYRIAGRWEPADAPSTYSAYIMPDISPYKSMLTGELITSRSVHREHLRAHGCIEVGNERLPPPRKEETWNKDLRRELIARLDSGG